MKKCRFTIADPNYRYQNIVAYKEPKRHRRDFLIETTPGDYVFIKYMFCNGDKTNLSRVLRWCSHYSTSQNTRSAFVLSNLESYRLFCLLMLLLCLLLKVSIRILKLGAKTWSIIHVFSCILGNRLNIRCSFKEKVCYILLIVLWLYVSNDLLESATDSKLEVIRILVENYQDLDDWIVPIHSIHITMYDFANSNVIETLKNKTYV